MIVNRRAPHGTIYALESLEVVLIASAFDQDVSVAFLDDGVYQLAKDQDTQSLGNKNFARAFRALADYEIKKLLIEHESLTARGLTPADLMLPVEILSAAELAAQMAQQDMILSS